MRLLDDINILASRIRHLRNSKGWTQNRLAQEINIHPTYISRIESCEKTPTVYIISRIAEVLEVKVYELFMDFEDLEKPDYKRRKIINIVKESHPSYIDIYFPLINALDKERRRKRNRIKCS
ncbi:MAG: helix-turn-helix transcriptional regulator [Candidatus Omnitrophota bacterium]|jgi:transcriptional regulator with XRE-family HTH domain